MKHYEFSEQVLGHIIRDKAETIGDKISMKFQEGQEVTFLEVDQITNKLANGLAALGVKKLDTVALMLPNSLESVFCWYACSKLGAIDVPINLANKGQFLSYIINDSEAKTIILDFQFVDRLKFIENELPKLEKVVISSDGSPANLPDLKFEVLDYDDLLNAPWQRPQVQIRASEVQTIIYTSGTTGPSKGVMSPHAQVYLSAAEFVHAIRATSKDVFFTCLPLYHSNARWLCVLPAMLSETRVVIYERFSATKFWDQIRKAGATIYNSLGAFNSFIYNQPPQASDADNPVRVCMAAPMPKDIHREFEQRFNLKIVEGYGTTESGIVAFSPYDSPRIGTCGKPVGSIEIMIVDENDHPVPPKVVGEMVIRSRVPYGMFLGYYNMPEKTLESIRNFFYHTGDAAYMDEEGYLFFVDRTKDCIRRRGENISSFEVESVVNSHPSVVESCAVAVKSELSEDEVKIVVVLREGAKLPHEELLAFCEPRMPYFAIPRYIEYVSKLPKTSNEKVQKKMLREAGVTPSTWDREKAGYKINR